eukprot:TRINITY_DN7646_c0_g1_i2.p1 TRINITY_DN7646_c0_g1~~TRINITY_DN7646_c0_g1_i2.p1  ORF type:complete len:332 (+),score=47.64 TRINITY_DN7646_c0_g1_i2:536-1531(+)
MKPLRPSRHCDVRRPTLLPAAPRRRLWMTTTGHAPSASTISIRSQWGARTAGTCSTRTACWNTFALACNASFPSFSHVYHCPMCYADIEEVVLPDGQALAADKLKEQFYSPATDFVFSKKSDGPSLSFFEANDEVKDLALIKGKTAQGGWMQQAAFPCVIMQLLDSDGSACTLEEDAFVEVDVAFSGLEREARLDGNVGRFQINGTCLLGDLTLYIHAEEDLPEDKVVPLCFRIRVCDQSEHDLPVHGKEIYAGVRFPSASRETLEYRKPRTKKKEAPPSPADPSSVPPAQVHNDPAASPCRSASSASPPSSTPPPRQGKAPNSDCECTVL